MRDTGIRGFATGPWAAAILALLVPPLRAQTTSRASLGTGGVEPDLFSFHHVISDDGRYVLFQTEATNLIPGDVGGIDVFLRDRVTGVTTIVSVATGGSLTWGWAFAASISADARYVTFSTNSGLVVPHDGNAMHDVFVHDRQTVTTSCVSSNSSLGWPGNGDSWGGSMSADGRSIAFHSDATDLVPGDTNDFQDVFVRDREASITARASVDSLGLQANGASFTGSISADGRFVVFVSAATNLVPGDTNQVQDIFVRDLVAGMTERVSLTESGGESNGRSDDPAISGDGRYVVFESSATNLVTPYVPSNVQDIYVRDRVAGTTKLVSVASDGTQANGASESPSISMDGRCVSFVSWASNLVPSDTNQQADVFRHELPTGTTTRASVGPQGAQLNAPSRAFGHSVSASGRYVVFNNVESFLPGDTGLEDCFVRDFGPTFESFCPGDGSSAPCPCGNTGQSDHGCDNSDATGGARLGYSGAPLRQDTVVLQVTGERASSLTIFLQGDLRIAPVGFGDGLRCVGGRLKRLYVKSSVNGIATAPVAGEPPITARSAALGDPIPPGATRFYMTYYRDPEPSFCPNPGSSFNSSNGLAIVW